MTKKTDITQNQSRNSPSVSECLKPNKTSGIIIISIIVGAFLVGILSGYFIGKGNTAKTQDTFNPTIDGIVNENEYWELARWHHVEYLIPESYTDQEYPKAYNHFLIDFNDTSLLILADLVSDVTNDTMSEYFSIFIDTNGDGGAYTSLASWNDNGINHGSEAFTYYPRMDAFANEIPTLSGWYTSLNATNVEIAFGFQTTIYGNISHRVYEVQISLSALELFDTRTFGVGFYGYGTMASYLFGEFWSAPSTIGAGIFYQSDILEYEFYNCGTSHDAYDIDHIPTD